MSTMTSAYLAPTAVVTGIVTLGEDCSVWHGAVLRGDSDAITVGPRTNIQDNAVVHVSHGHPTVLGEGVIVGHGAIVHGCTIGDNTLIGMGSVIMDNAVIGNNCIIGAGSLVTGGTVIPDGHMAFGRPARVVKELTDEQIEHNKLSAEVYVQEILKEV